MIKYMLDTNICIYVMKNKPEKAKQLFNQHSDEICVSSIVLTELLFGAEKSQYPQRNKQAITEFLSHIPIIGFDRQAAEHTAAIRATLEKQGTPIGTYDTMIAGHARSQSLTLVSNNQKEFGRVDALVLDNWV